MPCWRSPRRRHPSLRLADLLGIDAPDDCRHGPYAAGAGRRCAAPTRRCVGTWRCAPIVALPSRAGYRLTTVVEQALRGALRDMRLPDELAARLSAADAPQAAYASGWRADPRLRIALVALPVLALIVFLIFPRGARDTSVVGRAARRTASRASRADPAGQRIFYTPAPGSGVWHARYAVQWAFAGGTNALLAADQWFEPASGRHRLQLVHQDGGGPYEFELSDGVESAWYAVSPAYAPRSLSWPSTHPPRPPRSRPRPTSSSACRRRGCARGPGIRRRPTCGRRWRPARSRPGGASATPDGAILSLISFQGASPLAPPPDAPEFDTGPITVSAGDR